MLNYGGIAALTTLHCDCCNAKLRRIVARWSYPGVFSLIDREPPEEEA
jgi:hypothetical protein